MKILISGFLIISSILLIAVVTELSTFIPDPCEILIVNINKLNTTIIKRYPRIEYIKNELLAIENIVVNDVGPGRITQAAVWGLLSRLHLNAAVYRDPYAEAFDFQTADMDRSRLKRE